MIEKEESQTLSFPHTVNKVVSEGGENAKEITKLVKQDGKVIGYELSNGQHISVAEAISMAKNNELQHVGVSTSKDGSEYIRSLADGDESNNLGNLPSITLE
ncbi:hypothetical protein CS063_05720 [Sporanaerobium hydrogeniformans]|uniref:Uncharacterized protein n=1 Tax=Sporanaerobium hydrogeniformans TaxID=3072179 RepID=A0AC61DD23_9FIRM|nr:DUF3892 domain-containing protein [Sporanaerobium hydrogeniformans]PHV71189.1 hypothetical protein CS063_05720 [Sporanaerobium hydrogeniformans]